MNEPRLIVFLGTVGSGKSTQMKLLASELHKKGLNVKTTSIKTNHLFAQLLTRILVYILVKNKKDVYPVRALIEEKPGIFRRLFKLWLILDMFSISLRFLLTISLPTRMDCTILVEEYIPATISDYIYLSRALDIPIEASSFVTMFMLKLIHLGGSINTVFLDAQLDTLRSRWKNRRSSDENPDYINMQRTTLLSLSKTLSSQKVLHINTTNQSIMETHKLIVIHFIDR